MARKEQDQHIEFDPLKGGLKHNPFAALRAKVEGSNTNAQSAPSTPTDSATSSPPERRSSATSADPRPSRERKSSTAQPAAEHDSRTAAGAQHTYRTDRAETAKARAANPQERVTVRIERTGRGGKTVTIVEGPGLANHALEPLAREIARGIGTGARVEDGTVVVQGDQRERLIEWLGARGFGGVTAGN